MTFGREIAAVRPTAEQLARARIIAAEHPGVCDPARIRQCGVARNGRRVSSCRCLDEAMASGSA